MMELGEKDLKDLIKNVPGKTSGSDGKCPKAEILLRVVDGKLSRKEKFSVIDHIYQCPGCLRKFQAIKEFHAAGQALIKDKEKIELTDDEAKKLMAVAGAKTGQPRVDKTSLSGKIAKIVTFNRPSYKYLSLIAASLVLILGLMLIFQESSPLGDITYRGAVIGKTELVSPRGDFRGNQIEFAWKAVEKARRYQVKLYDDELTPVWTSEKIQASSCRFPDEIFKKMKKNTPYFWKILVFFEGGEEGKSALQDFKLID
jgi:hypothetical protein